MGDVPLPRGGPGVRARAGLDAARCRIARQPGPGGTGDRCLAAHRRSAGRSGPCGPARRRHRRRPRCGFPAGRCVSPKRGDRVAPPADPTGGWELRFATTDAVKGGKRCVSRRRRTPSPRGTSCAPAPRHRHRPRDTINSKALWPPPRTAGR
ncbi:hypothetical protein RHRU231_420059 [Rhodococcus ruber]|uniref:Uncharacterized protein n=1 Tax=Rhodococcus ruber TaxID=1830 RepID=A0A098BJT5_9NOCA|nr:hypothetical protein RHRU231_420059 [Rhodococcus ruber]